jgi:C1A family cysteine protease
MNSGVFPSPVDPRDFQIARIAPIDDLPSAVILDHKIKQIRDQYFCGVCVGKSTANLMSSEADTELSTLYIQSRCKQLDGIPHSEGTYPRVALKVAKNEGSCPDHMLPYSKLQHCTILPAITPTLTEQAAKYKIESFARCNNLIDIKRALANEQLLLGMYLIGDNFMQYRTDILGKPTGNIYGYHLIIITGYDNSRNVLRIANSWGDRWGEKGFAWVSADVPVPEAWSVKLGYAKISVPDLKRSTRRITGKHGRR